jgi:hypothetical protein
MRWLLLVLGLLLAGVPALGQTTSVSGTITDQGAQAWANGTIQFVFRPSNSNPTGPYFQGGVPFNINTTVQQNPLPLDNTGSFSALVVPDNATITPSGSTFNVTVCPAATTPCFTKSLTITGATLNISASIIPPAVNLNLTNPFLGARAYTDSEVTGAQPGAIYFNVTDNRIHVCLQSGFPPCSWFVLNGGSGTVTSVSSGNFSPLFNVTVTNPNTTPAFSFTALNAPAGTLFGNPSGAPAPASFNTPTAFGNIVTSVTGTAPITSTGGTTPAIACPTCVTSVGGTTNQITSSGGTTPTLSTPATFIAPGSVRATTALRGATVTDDALTSGNCVQAGAAGVLANSGAPCAPKIDTATAAGCTTAGSSSNQTCDNTLTWIGGGFADTGYIPSCSGVDPRMQASGGDGSSGEVLDLNIRSFTTTQIVVTTTQLAARASKYDNVYCTGVHP